MARKFYGFYPTEEERRRVEVEQRWLEAQSGLPVSRSAAMRSLIARAGAMSEQTTSEAALLKHFGLDGHVSNGD